MMSKNKKRIMFLALEMDLGGLQRIVNLLIERIDKEEFVPYLCCLDRGGCFAEEIASHVEKMFIFKRKSGPMDLGLSIKLYTLLRENKIDIIHSQNGCISYAVLAGRLAGVRGIVHTDHGRLVPDKTSAIIEDRVSSLFVDRFVGVSQELTEYLRNRVGVSPKKLITIMNGVDSDTFLPGNLDQKIRARTRLGFGPNDKILGTVCRLDPIKNLELLINAFRGVVKTVPESRLLIVGDGPSRKSLMEYANVSGKFNFRVARGRLKIYCRRWISMSILRLAKELQ
jgi:glycosyltransferase involved in cell wall biosynthesis